MEAKRKNNGLPKMILVSKFNKIRKKFKKLKISSLSLITCYVYLNNFYCINVPQLGQYLIFDLDFVPHVPQVIFVFTVIGV